MLRKNIHILYGVGIGVLLVALVALFNHYWDSPTQRVYEKPRKLFSSPRKSPKR